MQVRAHRQLGTLVVLGTFVLAACGGDAESPEADASSPSATAEGESSGPAEPDARDLDIAISEPREDSVYPDVGDPGVDALHYDLTLAWTPETSTLDARESLTFRATATAEEFRLDFGEPLEISAVALDGEETAYEREGKDLVVQAPVEEDGRYVLEIAYGGTPEPVPVPTARSDFSDTGWTITPDGETWTMQEPFGAYTWYAVNDHPSDKALYDFTLSVPSPMVGVANGELESKFDVNGVTTTEWHLAEPAASYLSTVAFGEFVEQQYESASGVPINTWVLARSADTINDGPERAAEAMDWVEDKLGPYPYDTFGILVVDSESGMETQTMVTLGDTDYTTSPEVVVHELVHQWYGDQVTPNDWRDVWMNEGMAMYLQLMWEAEQEGIGIDAYTDLFAEFERAERAFAGPPADYDPDKFGSSNIYYGPALMWHELRQQIGNKRFYQVIRAWPAAQDNQSVGREEFLAFLEEQTGEELTAFFDAWLLGETTPSRN